MRNIVVAITTSNAIPHKIPGPKKLAAGLAKDAVR